MLNQLASFRRACRQDVAPDDITVVTAVRLHEGNPWVLDRLSVLGTHYDPPPKVMIVDFGSEPGYAKQLAKICDCSGFEYQYVDDHDVFSRAKARNIGALKTNTEFIFFNDVNVFGIRSLFHDLVEHANALRAGDCLDVVVDLPIYQLSQESTKHVWEAPDKITRSRRLREAMTQQVTAPTAPRNYVNPSSSSFLVRKTFFDLVGGYNETFRGHGSEDIEIFLRMGLHSRQIPLPEQPLRDIYRPVDNDFFGPKQYRGFRRFGEVLAYPSECSGLRVGHLPPPTHDGFGYANEDHNERHFKAQATPFLQDPTCLHAYDWMPRPKRVAVLLKQKRQLDLFMPLRLAGFRLELFIVENKDDVEFADERIASGELDAIAVFKPYLNAHRLIAPRLKKARAKGLDVIVVDRGLLPDSWFFAQDMPYADSSYESTSRRFVPTEEQRAIAREYRDTLITGAVTLEANGPFDATLVRRRSIREGAPVVLVPLQLENDVAITHFSEAHQPYADFVAEIEAVAAARPDLAFLVKPHPLSMRTFECTASNVTVCDSDDNIHALIELCDDVICYNSGVGFLAMLHSKPVTTVGNAFYNLESLGNRSATYADAIRENAGSREGPDEEALLGFLAWLLFEKYAFFQGESAIHKMKSRRARQYRDLISYQFPVANMSPKLRARMEYPFSERSYAAGRLGTGIRARKNVHAPSPTKDAKVESDATFASRSRKKLRKLIRDPEAFLLDALRKAQHRSGADTTRGWSAAPQAFFRKDAKPPRQRRKGRSR